MATIPMGEFQQARAVPRPNTTRVDNSAASRAGASIARAGQVIAGVGADLANMQERERAEAEALARAKAQNALFDDEVAQRAIVTDIEQRMSDGSLPYAQAQEELQTRLSQREPEAIADLDEVGKVNYQRGLQRNRIGATNAVDGLVKGARRADMKAQILGIRDKLGKMASDPNADVGMLVQAGSELRGLADAGGIGATFGKDHQDFADRVYKDNASARLVAGRDDMAALDALEADLTTEGGRYHGKLDASATNALLTSVQVRKAQLEAKAETASRKGESAAGRVLTQFEKQIASTVPAPIDVMQQWAETMQLGTPEQQAEFKELLQSEIEVRQLLSRPPAEQRTAVVELQARQRTEGATVQQQANLKRMQSAVEANLRDLKEQPLVAYQRQTGETVPPLDIQALVTGDVATVQGQVAARVDTLTALRQQYGDEVGSAVLLPQEAAALSAALEKGTPAQAAQFFGTLSNVFTDPAVYRGVMQQIAPDSPVRAYAGIIFAEQRSTTLRAGGIFRGAVKGEAGDIARTMLEGEALLNKSAGDKAQDGKGGKFPMPSPAEFTAEIETLVGNAFSGRPGAYETATQAVRAYYAGSAARSGDVTGEIDRKRVREAVRAVIGEPVDVNGSDVFPPWGMDESEFGDKLESAWEQAAPQLPVGFPRDMDDYTLRQVSGNAYRLVGAGGAFVVDAGGKPLTLVVNR